jgi:hypothetical protein
MTKKLIYKRSLAIELTKLGHNLLKIEENKFRPQYKVYIFESTFELQEDMFNLTNR